MVDIKRFDTTSADCLEQLKAYAAWENVSDNTVTDAVQKIVADVRERGDAALVEYTNQFDCLSCSSISELILDESQLEAAQQKIGEAQKVALQEAAKRIRDYHEHQLQDDWTYTDDSGSTLGQKITPIQRIGVYVPGGKAAYPSTVLMTVIPALVAGVEEVVLVSPAPNGEISNMVLAAASIAGVKQIFTVGGAQAIAALAYGTSTIPAVDKIVGPGNAYVATAKQQVYGKVDIDMVAGPSELLVIGDGSVDPRWIVQDLFSQAEHDELAQVILVSPDAGYLQRVASEIDSELDGAERRNIISESLANRGALVKVRDLSEAAEVSNLVAPEHLELAVQNPQLLLEEIHNAGAVFLGGYTSEAIGDYVAGPSHVLPTSGTARFSSPLGVYDFQKRTSIIQCTEESASRLGKVASVLAREEGLIAHARSAEKRIKDEN